MKAFLFLIRVGFLLNLIFLLCMILRYVPAIGQLIPQPVVAVMVIAGWLLSVVVNVVTAASWLALTLKGLKKNQMRFILVFNMCILVFQLLFYFST